jgi:hypothetical protein
LNAAAAAPSTHALVQRAAANLDQPGNGLAALLVALQPLCQLLVVQVLARRQLHKVWGAAAPRRRAWLALVEQPELDNPTFFLFSLQGGCLCWQRADGLQTKEHRCQEKQQCGPNLCHRSAMEAGTRGTATITQIYSNNNLTGAKRGFQWLSRFLSSRI